ncbi:hypothetical protein [Puerhibacterium puerhi]|uniref:hypothetical protein n=1 Tax=Puerhibacterium puerhi TaxID=2692623 RepID=UPI001357D57C|nr:hypothetical protein [Puerhibacterium puerhi]
MTPLSENPHAKVSLESIYEVSLDTRERVIRIEGQLKELNDSRDDHEARIRNIERRLWIIAGASMVGGAGLGEVLSRVLGA